MLHAADWLVWSERSTERASDDLLGVLVLAAADLGQQTSLDAPREVLWRQLHAPLATIPPQSAHLEMGSPFTQWLAVASLAEGVGALRLAIIVLHHLEERVRIAHATHSGHPAPGHRPTLHEQVALCWTRRGRIARTGGQLDDAARWYRQAQRLVRREPTRDATVQATLGLAALAVNRGNYPEVVRHLGGLMRSNAGVPSLYRIPSHHLMAVARRKQARYIDALLHVWIAFDLLDATDFRREQLIGTMAEIALEAGDLDAAIHGFATVLRSSAGPLVRAPALLGAVRARAQQAQRNVHGTRVFTQPEALRAGDPPDVSFDDLADQLQAMAEKSLAPTEAVLVQLARAELEASRGAPTLAEAALDIAENLARSVGLYERLFMIDAVRLRLARAAASSDRPPGSGVTPRADSTPRRTRHPALHRLLSLR